MATCATSFQGLPLSGGTITGNLAVTGAISGGGVPILQRQASTPNAGTALINGTGNIITWTAPADGNVHRAMLILSQDVTVAETGGQVTLSYTSPDGTSITGSSIFPGGGATGVTPFNAQRLMQSGSTISIVQNTALTAGTASVWAEIWGS